MASPFSVTETVLPDRSDSTRDVDALTTAHIGDLKLTNEDVVFADADGVLFVPNQQVEQVVSTSHDIWERERKQAQRIQSGQKLREQFQFDKYLVQRQNDETYTFRQHLRNTGGAIEE